MKYGLPGNSLRQKTGESKAGPIDRASPFWMFVPAWPPQNLDVPFCVPAQTIYHPAVARLQSRYCAGICKSLAPS